MGFGGCEAEERFFAIKSDVFVKNSMMGKRKLRGIIAGAVALLFVVLAAASCYMMDYSLSNKIDDRTSAEARRDEIRRDCPWTVQWMDSVYETQAVRDTFITMPSGERHHAIYLRAPRPTLRTAIVVHGYKVRAEGMLHIAYLYNKVLGWNVLLPDLPAHGGSEGDDIQMGWKDRWDVLHWAAVADTIFGKADSTGRFLAHTEQVMHGISMGAATVMSVSGEETPGYVKAFVEDCGYTSVWEEFAVQLRDQFSLPPFPLMHITSVLCGLLHGWTFDEASPQRQVGQCAKPMLFIHGDNDSFVPTWMVHPLYRAHTGCKRLYLAPGSAHARAYCDHPGEYETEVKRFLGMCGLADSVQAQRER